eukprot:scaffold9106_cov118-Isochrysis_galbana.AAC.3
MACRPAIVRPCAVISLPRAVCRGCGVVVACPCRRSSSLVIAIACVYDRNLASNRLLSSRSPDALARRRRSSSVLSSASVSFTSKRGERGLVDAVDRAEIGRVGIVRADEARAFVAELSEANGVRGRIDFGWAEEGRRLLVGGYASARPAAGDAEYGRPAFPTGRPCGSKTDCACGCGGTVVSDREISSAAMSALVWPFFSLVSTIALRSARSAASACRSSTCALASASSRMASNDSYGRLKWPTHRCGRMEAPVLSPLRRSPVVHFAFPVRAYVVAVESFRTSLYPHYNCTRPVLLEDGSAPHAVLSHPLYGFVVEQVRLRPRHAPELRDAGAAGPNNGPGLKLQRWRIWVGHLQCDSLLKSRVIRPHL